MYWCGWICAANAALRLSRLEYRLKDQWFRGPVLSFWGHAVGLWRPRTRELGIYWIRLREAMSLHELSLRFASEKLP